MDIFEERRYEFSEDDCENCCFICGDNYHTFYILRQIVSMKMVHLCEECLLGNLKDYYLDNTRPWMSKQSCGR